MTGDDGEQHTQSSVEDLFIAIDTDCDGLLDASEVSILFQRLEPEQSSASAANAAVEALLEADSDCDERLSKVEFHRLLSRLCTTAGLTTEQGAQRLLDSLRGNSSGGMGGAMAAADAVKTVSQDGDILGSASQNAVPVEHARLLALFQAWDSAGDGRICFNELCQGLAKLNRAADQDIAELLRSAASVLAVHDKDGDRMLDLQEFKAFLSAFMHAAGYELDAVLDELTALAATKLPSRRLQHVLDNSAQHIAELLGPQPAKALDVP